MFDAGTNKEGIYLYPDAPIRGILRNRPYIALMDFPAGGEWGITP